MVVLTEFLNRFLNSFDFIPSLLHQYAVLMEQFPLATAVLIAAMIGGLIFIAVKKPGDEVRLGLVSVHTLLATIVMMIAVGKNGYHYQGIFATFELFTTWAAPAFLLDYIWFSLPKLLSCFQRKKATEVLVTVVSLPLCLAWAVAVANYIGIPVFRAAISLIMKDFFRESMIPVCIRVSFYAGILMYFVSIPEIGKVRTIPTLLFVTIVTSIVACFYPAFLAFVIVVCGIGFLFNTFDKVWEHSTPAEKVSMSGSAAYLSTEEKIELENQLMLGRLSQDEVIRMKKSVASHGELDGTDQLISSVNERHYPDE